MMMLNLNSGSKFFIALICVSLLACSANKEPVGKSKTIKIVDSQNKNSTQEVKAHNGKKKVELANVNNLTSDSLISGKPHAPIELKFSLPENISLNESILFELSLIVSQEADNLIISFAADDGVSILNKQKQIMLGQQSKGQVNDIRVSLLPERSGLLYFHITATLIDGELQQSRSFAIPLAIGDIQILETLNGGREIQQGKSGQENTSAQGIISMPAIETTD